MILYKGICILFLPFVHQNTHLRDEIIVSFISLESEGKCFLIGWNEFVGVTFLFKSLILHSSTF